MYSGFKATHEGLQYYDDYSAGMFDFLSLGSPEKLFDLEGTLFKCNYINQQHLHHATVSVVKLSILEVSINGSCLFLDFHFYYMSFLLHVICSFKAILGLFLFSPHNL